MSINSSSFFNYAHASPHPPSFNSSSLHFYLACDQSMASRVLYTTYTVTNVLVLLPLYILTLYVGFQRRRQHTTSHSDFFTYHMVTVEIFGVFGSFLYILHIYAKSEATLMVGILLSCIIFPGQTLFHCLTCVERYLAVVHPVTYMRLRETGGVRIRNISVVCAWLLCFGWVGMTHLYFPEFPFILLFVMLGVSIIVILFCCLSVLCVLTHPAPGEVGGNKGRVDQSKQRAFYIITAIAGVLLFRFLGLLITFSLDSLQWIHQDVSCALMDFGLCTTVPSSLVLPLLFLQKSGKLACCRNNNESG